MIVDVDKLIQELRDKKLVRECEEDVSNQSLGSLICIAMEVAPSVVARPRILGVWLTGQLIAWDGYVFQNIIHGLHELHKLEGYFKDAAPTALMRHLEPDEKRAVMLALDEYVNAFGHKVRKDVSPEDKAFVISHYHSVCAKLRLGQIP